MAKLDIQIILEGIIVFLGLYVVFIRSYFSEKGKNQATKEDIGEVTKIIENIKSSLSQQNELLKAQLSLTNQHKLDMKSAEREAIFEFNKQKSAWIYSLFRFSFFKYNLENYKEINLTVLHHQKRQYEFDLADAHLTLFMHDTEFMELKNGLIVEVIELDKLTSSTIYDLYYSFSKAEVDLKITAGRPGEQAKIRYDLNEELLSIVNRHKKMSGDQIEKVNDFENKLRELLCKRLKILEYTDYS